MCRGGHCDGRAVSGSRLGGSASSAGRFVPLIALFASSLLLATARGADSSSHSLRHHGAHRPPETSPYSPESNSSARNQLLFREGEDVFIPCDLTAASTNASSSDDEDVQWFHDGDAVAIDRPPHRTQSSGPTSEVLRSLGFGDMGAQVLGEGPAGSDGGGKFQWERVGPNKTRLRIRGAGRSEEGSWQCRKTSDVLGTHPPPLEILMIEPPHTVYLSVEGRKVGAVGGARLEGTEDEDDEDEEDEEGVEVREDASITVRCVAEGGRPPPSLSWLLDDRLASHASTDLSSPHSSGIGIHVGSVARALHGARISCVARHPALPSTLTASLKLNVLYSPSFGISREPGFGFLIREGMPVSLKCDVDSNPPAAPLWRKDNGDPGVPQSGDDGFLNFTSIRREHSGWYKCTAHHRFGLFSSIGYFLNVRYKTDPGFPSPPIQPPEAGTGTAKEEEEEPPTVHSVAPNDPLLPPNQQHQVVEVTLGGAVRLSCEGKDFSGPAPCWGRVEGEGTVDPLGEGSALSLDRVLYGDAGVYACTPRRRKVGVEEEEEEARREEAKRTFKVIVTGRPVVYPANRTIKAAKGTRRLSFSVEFCAHPPHSAALWMFQPPPARLQPLRQEDPGNEEEGAEGEDQRLHLLLPPPVHHHRGPLLLWPGDRDHSRGLIAHNVTSGGSNPNCYQSALTVREVSSETAGEYAFVVRSSEGVAQGLVHLELNGVPSDGPYHPAPPPPVYQPPSFPVASSLPSSGRALPKAPPSVPEKEPPPVKDAPSSSSSSPSLFPSSTSSASPSSPSLLLALLLLPLLTSLLSTQSLTFPSEGSVFCTSHQL